MGHATALQPRREVDRVCQRPRRRGQHLDHGRRRGQPGGRHHGGFPPTQFPGLESRRRVHRCAQALHLAPFAGCRRDLAVPQKRRCRPPTQRASQRPEGPRRAGVFTGRALRLLQPRQHAGRHVPVQQGFQWTDLHNPPYRSRIRRQRNVPVRGGWRDPAHAFTRRKMDGFREARGFPVDTFPPRHEKRKEHPDLRRPPARPAGDLGDPRRVPGDGLDTGQ